LGRRSDSGLAFDPVGLLPLIVIKVREVVEQQAGSTQQPSQSAQRH